MWALGDRGSADASVCADVYADVLVEYGYGFVAFAGVTQAVQPAGDNVFFDCHVQAVIRQIGGELDEFHTGVNVLLHAGYVLDGGKPKLLELGLGPFLDKDLLQILGNVVPHVGIHDVVGREKALQWPV